jgi:ribosome-binding factor A
VTRLPGSQARQDRKLAQLCAQVEEVVGLALGDSVDERLRQLTVQSVVPGPDGGRLVVCVRTFAATSLDELDAIYVALEGARAWLRRQVAAEIHRKRAPDLAFRVLPPWEGET